MEKQSLKILTGVAILALAALNCGKSTRPEPVDETFYIGFEQESVSGDVGDTLTMTGVINSVEGLFAISFDLMYDTSIVTVEGIGLPPDGILGQNALDFHNEIDGGISVSLGRIQTSGNDNVSASGMLFEIRFIARTSGSTDLNYQEVYIIDETGQPNPDLAALEMRGAGVIIR